ncbi:hypothetical protein [Roseinatronobacter alkalisoli]|uniref:Uncharacterized protein n=1 Tax=Roseinatronobacter alkalisoli TaxID=3028235 RepID=A0ABT5T6Y5_9RHOB|nr:hypothetical protein [Roseinatronobacter sp. HJB301]MDD7970809.1 hypothetical protein [Roseinatronobacter sp. HJB301]
MTVEMFQSSISSAPATGLTSFPDAGRERPLIAPVLFAMVAVVALN